RADMYSIVRERTRSEWQRRQCIGMTQVKTQIQTAPSLHPNSSHDSRPSFRAPATAQVARVHCCCRSRARTRYRREHGRVRHRQRDAVFAAWLCTAEAVGAGVLSGHEKPEELSRLFVSDAER